jgi:hypothetical protein
MPYKLLLSVVLMALAAATLMPALRSYQATELEGRIRVTVAEVASAARAVLNHPGSSRTVAVDLGGGWGVRLNRLTIGAPLDAPLEDVAVIAWSHTAGGSGRTVVTSTGGPVPMCGEDGGQVVLADGRALLVLEARHAPEGSSVESYVEVSLA